MTDQPSMTLTANKTEASTIVHRFQDQVFRYKDRLAVKHDRISWTYEELAVRANGIAGRLLDLLGEKSEPVAVLGETTPELVASILGVLLAGKYWIPLDSHHPPSRWSCIIQDAGAKCLIASTSSMPRTVDLNVDVRIKMERESLPLDLEVWHSPIRVTPNDISHILYTSGSTGQPKGVVHNQKSSLEFIKSQTQVLGFNCEDRFSLIASHTHIAYVTSMLRALLNGASLHIFDLRQDGTATLPHWISEEGITVWQSVPTLFRHFVATIPDGLRFPEMRLVHLGGEPMSVGDVELFRNHFAPRCRLLHNYGSSETSSICGYLIDSETPINGNFVPIGKPWPGKQVYIEPIEGHDSENRHLGEIIVKSHHLSLGYWNQPEQTARAFSKDPDNPGMRIFRTGDLGRILSDGNFVHIGRKDEEVKIRGHRIHPMEIEAAILQHVDVRHAAVILRKDLYSEPALVAFLETSNYGGFDRRELSEFLQSRLPHYMLPCHYVVLKKMPCSTGSKIDRDHLRQLPIAASTVKETIVPRTLEERYLAEIWVELLSLNNISILDSFFVLGGHSLHAMRLSSRIYADLGIRIKLIDIFKNPTIEKQAILLQNFLEE